MAAEGDRETVGLSSGVGAPALPSAVVEGEEKEERVDRQESTFESSRDGGLVTTAGVSAAADAKAVVGAAEDGAAVPFTDEATVRLAGALAALPTAVTGLGAGAQVKGTVGVEAARDVAAPAAVVAGGGLEGGTLKAPPTGVDVDVLIGEGVAMSTGVSVGAEVLSGAGTVAGVVAAPHWTADASSAANSQSAAGADVLSGAGTVAGLVAAPHRTADASSAANSQSAAGAEILSGAGTVAGVVAAPHWTADASSAASSQSAGGGGEAVAIAPTSAMVGTVIKQPAEVRHQA